MSEAKGFTIVDGKIVIHAQPIVVRRPFAPKSQKFANGREKQRKSDKRQKQKGWD